MSAAGSEALEQVDCAGAYGEHVGQDDDFVGHLSDVQSVFVGPGYFGGNLFVEDVVIPVGCLHPFQQIGQESGAGVIPAFYGRVDFDIG